MSNSVKPLSLTALANLCEKAEFSTRELDGRIFIAVTPGVADAGRIDQIGGVVGWWPRTGPYQSAREVPRYTFLLDDAVSLVPDKWHWRVGKTTMFSGWACVNKEHPDHAITGETEFFANRSWSMRPWTPALALCTAALLARAEIDKRSKLLPQESGR